MKCGLFACLFVMLCFANGLAQDGSFTEKMEFALNLHDTASVFDSELKAVRAFEELGDNYPGEWLPQYWAAYLYTQIGRLVDRLKRDEDAMVYIDKAQLKYQRASDLLANKSAEQQSGFHALQHLIYRFRWQFSKADEAERYASLGAAELNKAITVDPKNPLGLVLAATSLINQGVQEGREDKSNQNLSKILAGNIMLQEAKKKFERRKRKRSQTTHWNEEWIPYWLPLSERLLRGENN